MPVYLYDIIMFHSRSSLAVEFTNDQLLVRLYHYSDYTRAMFRNKLPLLIFTSKQMRANILIYTDS